MKTLNFGLLFAYLYKGCNYTVATKRKTAIRNKTKDLICAGS